MTPRAPSRQVLLAAAAIALAFTTPVLGQTLGQAPPDDVSWVRVIGALILSLALAVGAAFAIRYRLRGGQPFLRAASGRRLQLIETLRLSHQVDVCLLRCDGKDYIVAASPHGAVVVAGGELPGNIVPAPVPEPAKPPPRTRRSRTSDVAP